MIDLRGLTKIYKTGDEEVYALKDLNLIVEKGEFVVIVGPSGCGKSTLLNLIGGIDTPTKGKVLVGGKDLSDFNDRSLTLFRRHNVGFVFQFLA